MREVRFCEEVHFHFLSLKFPARNIIKAVEELFKSGEYGFLLL